MSAIPQYLLDVMLTYYGCTASNEGLFIVWKITCLPPERVSAIIRAKDLEHAVNCGKLDLIFTVHYGQLFAN